VAFEVRVASVDASESKGALLVGVKESVADGAVEGEL
jgi:hypothetical protein